jgi:hypothetical protein
MGRGAPIPRTQAPNKVEKKGVRRATPAPIPMALKGPQRAARLKEISMQADAAVPSVQIHREPDLHSGWSCCSSGGDGNRKSPVETQRRYSWWVGDTAPGMQLPSHRRTARLVCEE